MKLNAKFRGPPSTYPSASDVPEEVTTIYNMAGYDMLAIHNIRTTVHELYVQSYDNFSNLVMCYELLTQMLLVYKYNIPEKRRRKMMEKFNDFEKKLSVYFGPEKSKMKIPVHEFFELRRDLRRLFDYAYKAKHGAGLGIPSERRPSATTKLDQAMGVKHVREKLESDKQEEAVEDDDDIDA